MPRSGIGVTSRQASKRGRGRDHREHGEHAQHQPDDRAGVDRPVVDRFVRVGVGVLVERGRSGHRSVSWRFAWSLESLSLAVQLNRKRRATVIHDTYMAPQRRINQYTVIRTSADGERHADHERSAVCRGTRRRLDRGGDYGFLLASSVARHRSFVIERFRLVGVFRVIIRLRIR